MEGEIAAIIRNRKPPTNCGSIPYGMRSGWLGHELDSSSCGRDVICEGFAAGLEGYAAAVLTSLRQCDSHYQALTLVRETHATSTEQENGENHCEELGGAVSKVGVAEGCVVLDGYSCKVSAWRAALSIVRTLSACSVIHHNYTSASK